VPRPGHPWHCSTFRNFLTARCC